jgi:TfoX N-terminal domain
MASTLEKDACILDVLDRLKLGSAKLNVVAEVGRRLIRCYDDMGQETMELPMAFDETLAARIRDALARRRDVEEKKMFGCVCFFLNGNALAGVWKDRLIARLGPDEGEAALREPHVRAFDITGRPMRNWVAVEPEGVEKEDQLKAWIDLATTFVKTMPRK